MPAGRPTSYTKAIGEEVLQLMSEGLSLTAAMAALGYHRDTAYEWREKYPEFSDAVKLGQGKRQLFLERRFIRDDITGPQVAATSLALKNTGTGDWRDKQDIEHSGTGIQVVIKKMAPED
jgi:hypothetical protein